MMAAMRNSDRAKQKLYVSGSGRAVPRARQYSLMYSSSDSTPEGRICQNAAHKQIYIQEAPTSARYIGLAVLYSGPRRAGYKLQALLLIDVYRELDIGRRPIFGIALKDSIIVWTAIQEYFKGTISHTEVLFRLDVPSGRASGRA